MYEGRRVLEGYMVYMKEGGEVFRDEGLRGEGNRKRRGDKPGYIVSSPGENGRGRDSNPMSCWGGASMVSLLFGLSLDCEAYLQWRTRIGRFCKTPDWTERSRPLQSRLD